MKSKVRKFLACFILLPITVLVIVTFPFWAPIAIFGQYFAERVHRFRMHKLGRYASWQSVLEKSEHGSHGTIIFEQAQKTPLRVWWTPDESIVADAPFLAPTEDEIDYLRLEVSPFMQWLHDRYTSESGTAILTDFVPARHTGFATRADFGQTGFSRIIPLVRLS